MSIVVDFAPEVENQLNDEAVQRGISPDAYLREIVQDSLQTRLPKSVAAEEKAPSLPVTRYDATLALLEKWRAEDEAYWSKMTPEEREYAEADAEADWEELKAGLNENRRLAGDYRVLFP